MKFIDLAENGNNSPLTYVSGILLIFILYFLGSLGILVDIHLNFPSLSIESMDAQFYQTMGHTRFLFWVLFPYLLVFIGVLLHHRWMHQRPIIQAFTSMENFRWKRLFFAFFFILIVMVGLMSIQIYADSFGHGQAYEFQFDAAKFFLLLVVSLLMLSVQTACEELLFRSYLLKGLKLRIKRTGTSILISSLMFGLMHIGNPEVQELGYHMLVYYVLSGLFLALITTVDDGLELAIGYHFANNLIAAIFVTTDWQVFRTDALFLNHQEPDSGWSSLIFLLILLPSLFVIFKRIYKWPSWKEIMQSM